MKQTNKKVPCDISGKRFSCRMHSLLILLYMAVFIILGTTQLRAAESPAIFWGISISPYGVPGDTPSTIHIEAYHYGRPLVNIPCSYNFYVLEYETKRPVEMTEEHNKKRITLPSNAGRLNEDFDVYLPTGHYLLYYEYSDHGYTEGPFLFSDFWVGERPPTPQTATISNFALKETWLSTIGANSILDWYYSSKYGIVENDAGTIEVTLDHWHKNLREGQATVKLDDEGSNFIVDNVTYRSREEFTADFTQPVILTVISEDGSVTKDYTVTVVNGTGESEAKLGNSISFNYTNRYGQFIYTGAGYDEESGEYIMQLNDKMWDISNQGFSGVIMPSFGSSVMIDDRRVSLVSRYDPHGQRIYRGSYSNLTPAETYTITVTSADETVTNKYIVRINDKVTPPVWNDDLFCSGFRYRNEPHDNIEDAIPVEWLEQVSIHLSDWLLEENEITDGYIGLRLGGEQNHIEIVPYPQDNPDIPENEIWFPYMLEITAGEYEVILYSYPHEYLLGGLTLVDEIPDFYTINIATFANGKVSSHKDECTEGTEVTLWCWDITSGYEMASIEVYKTGEENTKVALNGSGSANYATRTFNMPAYDVTVAATFQRTQPTLDAEAIEEAKTIIETATYILSQADVNTEAEVKIALAGQINDLIPAETDITITADNIVVYDFVPASNNVDGSFTFTVSLTKGSVNGSADANGVISSISVYTVTIGTFEGGSVSASTFTADEGDDILLTISLETGYELETIDAHKTGDNTMHVTLTGTGHKRTFTMPAHSVTITAKFRKIQAQADKEAVEDAAANIEGGTFDIAQAIGYTKAAIKTWLINTLRAMFADLHNIVLRSDVPPLVGDVEVTNITLPTAGTTANPKGVDGSFTFTVTLTRGETLLMTETVSGVIKATPYKETPPVTVTYTITASASEGGSISPSGSMSIDSGDNQNFIFTPDTDYEIAEVIVDGISVSEAIISGSYTFENITGNHTINVSFTNKTITGITGLKPDALTAYVQNGILHVTGLTRGQLWSVYSLTGRLIRQEIAAGNEGKVSLTARGVYIVKSGSQVVKVLYDHSGLYD